MSNLEIMIIIFAVVFYIVSELHQWFITRDLFELDKKLNKIIEFIDNTYFSDQTEMYNHIDELKDKMNSIKEQIEKMESWIPAEEIEVVETAEDYIK